MKIIEVKIYKVVEAKGWHCVLVQVITDEGIIGVGDASIAYGSGGTAAAGMIKDLADNILLGKDPFCIEAIWSEMYDHTFWAKGGGPIIFAGISAIETALWDIKGKSLGIPIYEMLGGKFRDKVRVYANCGPLIKYAKPEEYARVAERAVKDGYTALKFYPLSIPAVGADAINIRHVSLRSIDSDAEKRVIDIVKAIRNAIGPDIDLMLDMSAELTTDVIIRIGQKLEKYNLFFLEEPVDPFNVEALKKVSEHVNLSIAVGERLYTRYGFRRVMENHAADILQPDIGNTGGIMEVKKIAAMAEIYNMRIQPHVCASPVATAAALQLDACIPNFVIQETYPYSAPEHWNIVDHAPELDIKSSYMPISNKPGLGIELIQKKANPFLFTECKL